MTPSGKGEMWLRAKCITKKRERSSVKKASTSKANTQGPDVTISVRAPLLHL